MRKLCVSLLKQKVLVAMWSVAELAQKCAGLWKLKATLIMYHI